MNTFLRAIGVALLAACAFAPAAGANVLIGGTRVVLPAKDGEVTVRLTNENDRPALVQAWIDRGDATSTPDSVDTPFLVTPPMFRMEAGRDQSLRILYTREPLPADRESLFWLNVLDVPPKPADMEAAGTNYLQLAVRSRLKLFFRPEGLQGDPHKAPDAADLPRRVRRGRQRRRGQQSDAVPRHHQRARPSTSAASPTPPSPAWSLRVRNCACA